MAESESDKHEVERKGVVCYESGSGRLRSGNGRFLSGDLPLCRTRRFPCTWYLLLGTGSEEVVPLTVHALAKRLIRKMINPKESRRLRQVTNSSLRGCSRIYMEIRGGRGVLPIG